jgi:outer membrane protein OmpA-like peptidoglycan-associated protein
MSVRKLLLATAAFAVVGAGAASADDWSATGWYAGAGAGINWADDTEETLDFSTGVGGTLPVAIEWDTGWVVEADIGYRWAESWRLELEVSYRENDTDTFVSAGVPFTVAGDLEQLSVMANLLYDFDVTDTINFSLGAGIGAAQVEVEVTATGPTTLFIDESDQDWTWAYQGIAGISFETSDQTEIFIDYRYFVANDVDLQPTAAAFLPVVGRVSDTTFENHAVKFGFRYFFEGRPASVAEPTPPPQQPADVAKTYIVFFDFNKSNLTAEAQAVVAEAAEAYKATGSVRVDVIGHTDTVGSASYNQSLSERRAASVAAELVRLGVPQDAISTEGRGFSDPMVPTGPGVREPQNRRAVIDLK